jgi:hypothetical protein
MDAIQLITGFLGGGFLGGIVVALINTHYSNRAAKRERQIKVLDDQIRELYGPLFRLIVQSEKLFELYRRFHEAYDKEYIQKSYSDNEIAQERLRSAANETLTIANDYAHQIRVNRQRIMELVDAKYSFIDPDDIEVLQLLFEHHIRSEVEFPSEGTLRTPFMVYKHLGDVSVLPTEFILRMKEQFINKKKLLDSLSHGG